MCIYIEEELPEEIISELPGNNRVAYFIKYVDSILNVIDHGKGTCCYLFLKCFNYKNLLYCMEKNIWGLSDDQAVFLEEVFKLVAYFYFKLSRDFTINYRMYENVFFIVSINDSNQIQSLFQGYYILFVLYILSL